MENKKERLRNLKKRFNELKPITTKGFDSSEELKEHKKKNLKIFEEYYAVGLEIQKLEWELKTPEEQEKEKEILKLMKLKRDGKML